MIREQGSCVLRVLAVSLVVVITAPGTTWADMAFDEMPVRALPPPERLTATAEVDWGIFESRVSRHHQVAKGETLGAIAEAYYGSATLWKPIAVANPDTVTAPDRIHVGASLWIPPRRTIPDETIPPETSDGADEGLLPYYDAFWVESRDGQPRQIVSRATPGAVPGQWTRGGTLLFVPHDLSAPLIRGLLDGPVEIPESVREASPIAPFVARSLLKKPGEEAERVVFGFRLDHVDGQLVRSSESRTYVHADGHVVRGRHRSWNAAPFEEPAAAETTDESRWSSQLGIAIALAGLAMILGIATARRRQSGQAD